MKNVNHKTEPKVARELRGPRKALFDDGDPSLELGSVVMQFGRLEGTWCIETFRACWESQTLIVERRYQAVRREQLGSSWDMGHAGSMPEISPMIRAKTR